MSDLTNEDLKAEVKAILKGADLSTVTAKAVRKQIEEKLGCDLVDRRKEIDAFIMAEVEEKVTSEEEVSEEEIDEEPAAKRKKADDSEEDDYSPAPKKKTPAKRGPKGRKKKGGDSDEEWGKSKKKAKKSGGAKKATAFTKSYKLSPELGELVGSEIMPRHEVVKKMWAYIKENKLQDPEQKQFAVCDETLLKVIGVKRFRTFGMMKYLKDHFIEAIN